MDNKTVMAVVLSFLVIVAWQFMFPVEPPPPAVQRPAEQQAAETASKEALQQSEAPMPVVQTTQADEKEVVVENDLYRAVFTSRGGTIKSWAIKSYKDKSGQDVVLLKQPGIVSAAGMGPSSSFDLANVNFSVTGSDIKLDDTNRTGMLVFEYAGDGKSVRRTYTFSAGMYKVDLTDEVSGLPEYWITLGSDFGIVERDNTVHVGPTLLTGTDLEDLPASDLKEPKVFREKLKWIAQQDKYFFSALVPATPVEQARAFLVQDSPVVAFKAGSGTNRFHLYAGPKEHDRLASLDIGLEHVIDFGFFSIVARPLFWILKFFNQFIGNYGWAIILITIVTRIPFVPLMTKSQKSMKKLQEIQPLMNELKEKYKKDPKRQQTEMMALYKKHKVNPLGGCLPMLLQIPVFLALYQILLTAIELRGAPFMLWITDLSAPDTLFGRIPEVLPLIGGLALGPLPILMGATMFIQQKMTPTTMDPTQTKIMLMMPVIFTFVFLNMASGLVLYWLIGNVLGIIQQFFVNRTLAKEKAMSLQP